MTDLHDRIGGARSSLAFKAPCRVATTANITLSGEQTIDGVAVVEEGANDKPDRVLVKDQTDQTQNGIYTVSTGVWSRAKDFDGNSDIVTGTRIYVHAGTAGSGEYIVTTADPIVIDTSNIAFSVAATAAMSVSGPASATDNAIARYHEATGKIIQNSGITINDNEDVAGIRNITQTGYTDQAEIAEPASPAPNVARMFARDVSSRTELAFKNSSGQIVDLMRAVVSVKDYGATGDGATDDTAEIQAAIDATDANDGILIIPPGTYNVASDLTIYSVGDSNDGGMLIIANGAEFIGGNDLIIDSCKRLTIMGLDAPTMYLRQRGCWYSNFNGVRFRQITFGDATGTDFSSSAWNTYNASQFQAIVTAGNAGFVNAQWWYGCTFRGDAAQGFAQTEATALQFTGDIDTQQWHFIGGDISYHTDCYSIDGGNTSTIEVYFNGVYFDAEVPTPVERANTYIKSENCYGGNNLLYQARFEAAFRGKFSVHRNDRSTKLQSYAHINLIPNGDFRRSMISYVGAGLPVGNANSATITATTGDGPFERYLNVNQALTTSNSVQFRSRALPMAGIATGTMILRNAGTGDKAMRFTFLGLSFDVTIPDGEWTVVTVTTNTTLTEGNQYNLVIFTNDSSAFNVDVAYAGIVLGEDPPIIVPSQEPVTLEGSATYNPPSLADGAGATTTVTVTGAALGDFAEASFSLDLQGIIMTAYVSATDTVSVRFQNETTGTIDIGSGTLRCRVRKRTG